MGLIDFILNLACLLLWLNWRSVKLDPLEKATPATLAGTLRRAEIPRLKRWHFLAALGGLILLRALLYWQIGSAVNWAATLNLGAISLSFRSDFAGRMLLYSLGSFALTLAFYFLWLLFLSLAARPTAEVDPLRRLVHLQLGPVDNWPWSMKLLFPLPAGFAVWMVLNWPLAHWGLIPHPVSPAHRLEQAVLIGLGTYLAWKYLILALLALNLVNSYIYFGTHPLWSFVNAVARNLLKPLAALPLRVNRVDFAPVVGIVLVSLAAMIAERVLVRLYLALPF